MRHRSGPLGLALAVALALLAACGGKEGAPAPVDPAQRVRDATQALDDGRPKVALVVLGDDVGPGFDLVRVRALLALERWGDAQRIIAHAPVDGPDAAAMRCELASARSDVDGERACQAALAASPHDVRLTVALAVAIDRMNRPAEAEALLRVAVRNSDGQVAREALVAHLERFGWMREAVDATEAWLVVRPGDPRVQRRLVSLLQRKVKGDLVGKRPSEAAVAARRLLALAPEHQEVRYYLADALEATGDAQGAEVERAQLRAAGVPPPPPATGLPTAPTP